MTNPNDPAYPVRPDQLMGHCGLTKREYFAAMAMQGLLVTITTELSAKHLYKASIIAADSLIAELNKETK